MAEFASTHALRVMIKAQKRGKAAGIPSICSANRFVLEACLRQAAQDGGSVLIEATCNQVNQFGGYTGMTPAGFAAYVAQIAEDMDYPTDRIILGGDHLGPNPWQHLPAAQAMTNALQMVADYAAAGFCKIHLDASMRCADDKPGPLDPRVSAERAANLCAAAEAASSDGRRPVYVIGTEVPIPGGAQEAEAQLSITRPEDAAETLRLFLLAFAGHGLQDAWQRVIGLVVQPGVEFGDTNLFDYDHDKARGLSRWIETLPGIVFEAHSTDYQTPRALRDLVEDHFAILKVGPGLTFALREAVFALAHIEQAWLADRPDIQLSNIVDTLEQAMLNDPHDWEKYYHGTPEQQALARKYSFSDRIRYYWPRPQVEASLSRLLTNLEENPPPLPLLSQYMPNQFAAVRANKIENHPRALIWHSIQEALRPYLRATRG